MKNEENSLSLSEYALTEFSERFLKFILYEFHSFIKNLTLSSF